MLSNQGDDIDAIFIDHDHVSNYNPEQILPEPPDTIQKLREWLAPTSYSLESGEYRKHLSSHTSGTGDWLTSSETYIDWIRGKKHGLLWIKGIPGSGKSVLASKIIRDLSLGNPGTPILYFFFRQIIDANHKPEALLRDWLDQILEYSPPLQRQLKQYVKENRSLSSISMDSLFKDVLLAFSGLRDKVFCVADALDEMDNGNESFIRELAKLGNQNPEKIKVLITSRPVPAVEIPLRNVKYSEIRLQDDVVDIDIGTFVRRGLKGSVVSHADQQLILDAIPGRANGLFLYAKLALDAFLEPGANTHKVLSRLPADMNTMYTDLLRENAHRSGVLDGIQLLILQWATHATRPLRLLEMAEMLSATYTTDFERDVKTAKNIVRAACGPLLEILPDETICVVHHSFTEYLKGTTRSPDDAGYPVLLPGATHADLGLSCLRYLQARCLDPNKPGTASLDSKLGTGFVGDVLVPETLELKLKYPFLEYAANNWYIHFARSTAAGYDQTEANMALDNFIGDSSRLEDWVEIDWAGRKMCESGVTALHIAAGSGLTKWAEHLVSLHGLDVDVEDDQGRTALWVAANSGEADVVQSLLDAGADPGKADTHGSRPLHQAVVRNHPRTIGFLLSAGADPLDGSTERTPGTWREFEDLDQEDTPLMYSCQNGHLESAETFIPFLKGSETVHWALAWAAERGHCKVVERVLQEPNVDINRKVNGVTPIYGASSRDVDTVRLLLRKGADPSIICQSHWHLRHTVFDTTHYSDSVSDESFGSDSEDADGRDQYWQYKTDVPRYDCTALHRACSSYEHFYGGLRGDAAALSDILDLFLEKGADINQKAIVGLTPLHMAYDDPVWTRLLLDRGADPDVARDNGCTPLHDTKSIDTLVQLIEHGNADINKIAPPTGRSPLLHFCHGRRWETLAKFLEYGPDCNVTDKDGNGALHLVLMSEAYWHEPIEGLLRAGADPNLRNNAGQTPLEVIDLKGFSAKTLGLLVGAGADINVRDSNGTTLLFRAIGVSDWEGKPQDILEKLLGLGSSTEARDLKGRTLLHEAARRYPMLSPRGCISVGGRRVAVDNVTRLDFLISTGLDVHAVDYEGNTLGHELAWNCSKHMHKNYPSMLLAWRRLSDLGLDFDKPNSRGRTPLHNLSSHASRTRGSPTTEQPIDWLISQVKDINAADRDGFTALHMAAATSEYVTNKLLIAGADPRISTREGLTPLHLAAKSSQSNTVGVLLDALHKRCTVRPEAIQRGAWLSNENTTAIPGVDAEDDTGYTPLMYACKCGRPEVVSLLLKAGANAKNPGLQDACEAFEEERKVWNSGSERDPENGVGGGLILDETSYAGDGLRRVNEEDMHPYRDTERLDEIIGMLNDNGAELSLPRGPHRGEVGHGIEKGEANYQLLISTLKRREYDMVEQLFHLGVDFFVENAEKTSTNFGALVRGGFVALVDRIGALEAGRQHRKGAWHAAGDETRPGFGQNTEWVGQRIRKSNYEVRKPFLLQAIKEERPNLGVVRLLVEKFGVDTDELYSSEMVIGSHRSRMPEKESALHTLAMGYWWWHMAQALPYLIARGANLDAKNDKGQTPLHIALHPEDMELDGPYRRDAARLLLLAGADANAVDREGQSCLSYASHDVPMVHLLMQHGAVPRADALFAAINRNQGKTLEVLLAAGTDPNLQLRENRHKPFVVGRYNFDASMERQDMPDCEVYALYRAATRLGLRNFARSTQKENWPSLLEMIDILLAHGADPFARFLRCTTTECYHQKVRQERATEASDTEETGTLDTSLGWEHHEECTVLHQLLADGDIVHPFLLLPNIDPDLRDGKGRTVFHAACYTLRGPDLPLTLLPGEDADESHATVPSLFGHLISLGPDAEARDGDGRNAMHHMLRLRRHKRGGLIRKTPAILESLAYMTRHHPSLIGQRDKDGKTPMHLAVDLALYTRDTAAACLLLAAGADLSIADEEGNTALHSLGRKLWVSCFRPLFEDMVKHGGDVNARNARGETPLFRYFDCFRDFGDSPFLPVPPAGISYDQGSAMAAWEAAGADFRTVNNAGQGLLHVAAKGHYSRFKKLMARGLDPMLEDDEGKTAVDLAATRGNTAVLNLFKRDGVEDDAGSGEESEDQYLDEAYGL